MYKTLFLKCEYRIKSALPVDGQANNTMKVDSSGSFEMIDGFGQQDGFEPAKGSGSGMMLLVFFFFFLFISFLCTVIACMANYLTMYYLNDFNITLLIIQ